MQQAGGRNRKNSLVVRNVAAAERLCVLSCVVLWAAVLSSLKPADMSLSSKGPVNFEELLLWFQSSGKVHLASCSQI